MWHLIAHESELKTPGDFVVIGSIAVTNFDGELIGWDGRCSHRGMSLYRDQWKGNDPLLRCAYHGRCQRADKLRVKHEVRIVDGWVFACGWSMDFPDVMLHAPMPMKMPPMKLRAAVQYGLECPWDVAVENALDFDHVRTVHGTSLDRMQLGRSALRLHPDGGSTEFFDSGLWERLDQLGESLPKNFEDGEDYVHCLFAPDSCLSSTRGWTWSLQNYTPNPQNNMTIFSHRLYVAEGCESVGGAALDLNLKIFQEDAEIVKHVISRYGELGPTEKRIAHFREKAS